MTRHIKFRGLRNNGEWVYGGFCRRWNNKPCIVVYNPKERKDEPNSYEDDWGIYVDVHEDTIGQFTGVTDEHGKEVFEGDVLEADYKYDLLGYNGGVDPDNDCICYGVVEFDNDALQWVLNIYKAEYPISKQIEEDGCSLFPLQIFGHEYGYDNCNLKIIGNRFDKPSLISDKQ